MSLLGLFFMVTGATRAGYEGIKERSIIERNASEAKKNGAIAYRVSSKYFIDCYYLKGYGKVRYYHGCFIDPKTDEIVFGLDSAICRLQEEVLKKKSRELGLKGYIRLRNPYTPTTKDHFLKECKSFDDNKPYYVRDEYEFVNFIYGDKKANTEWDGRPALTEEVKKEMVNIFYKCKNFIFDGCNNYKDVKKMLKRIEKEQYQEEEK